ncbi:MAG: diacylglycerol kinase family lipid kinase [Lachnospiraceae bacterium]|nr:diacylglycerol kinase family lipid kinase [Lachnospiraceae bacterium]
MKNLLLVYNPHAGHGQIKQQLHTAVNDFTAAGFLVTTYPTQSRGDAETFVKQHGAGCDLLVVSGGDGTLHECANGVMALAPESRPSIGYIPAGSTNDFAASHGLALNIPEAVQMIISGSPLFYDVGQLGREYFTYVAAFGIFTDVPYDTPQELKNALGYLAYVFEGANRLPSYRPQHVKVTADGEEIEADFLLGFVSNTTSVGGFKKLLKDDIDLHDGLSELYLIRSSQNPIDFLSLFTSIVNKDYSSPLLIHRQVRDIRFESKEALLWTVDGEYGGSHTDVNIHTHTNALPLITPVSFSE